MRRSSHLGALAAAVPFPCCQRPCKSVLGTQVHLVMSPPTPFAHWLPQRDTVTPPHPHQPPQKQGYVLNIFLESKAYRAVSVPVLGWGWLWGSGELLLPPQNHPPTAQSSLAWVRTGDTGRGAAFQQSQRCSLIHVGSHCSSILLIFHHFTVPSKVTE